MSDANIRNNHENLHSRPFVSTLYKDNSHKTDLAERQEVIQKLEQRTLFVAPTAPVSLEGSSLTLETGSTLHQALQPGVASLKKLEDKAAFKAFIAKIRLTGYTSIQVNDQGEVLVEIAGRRQRFSGFSTRDPDLDEEFAVLVDLAKLTGGAIASTDRFELVQWLKFHGYNIPQTGEDARALLGFLRFEYPTSPASGNYWEMLSATTDSSPLLSPTQCAQIRALSKSYTGGLSMLDTLTEAVVGARTSAFQRSEANDVLQTMLSSAIGTAWANSYLKDLDWYGANENEPLVDDQRRQILLTALLLDLHPGIAQPEPRNHILGFNLYAAEHVEQSFAAVQTRFEEHLVRHHQVQERNAALAAHLLLAGAAPEFLVRDLPASLLLGTPSWVDLCRTVTVVEINAPGSSRALTYARLQQLMQYDSVSKPQQTLNALAAVDPVIDWALLHSIVTLSDVEASTQQALETATAAYDRYSRDVCAVAKALGDPLPTRKTIAHDILKKAAPDCDYLEKEVLYQKTYDAYNEVTFSTLWMSMVDLHMSGDLMTDNWKLINGGSVLIEFPQLLAGLEPAKEEFNRQFDDAYVTYEDAMTKQLELILSSLPLVDRARLFRGKVSCFTLRPSVAAPAILDVADTLLNPPDEFLDVILLENQKAKDAATGRYAVVLCTEYLGQLYCYELFTLQGKCRENPQLAELIKDKGLLDMRARENFSGSMSRNVKAQPVHQLPTDLECYTHGVPPGMVASSRGVIEKLAVLPAMADCANQKKKGYFESFYSGEADRLAGFILKHRPIATYTELRSECRGQTALEKVRIDRENQLDTFLNIVVPFKSCIQDLTSDDADRRDSGLGMCIIEVGMTLLLVVGAAAKIAVIATRAGTSVLKAARMAKTGLLLLNSLLNPLDGVPDLLRGGAKLFNRAIHRLPHAPQLANTVSDLRKLTATAPYGGLRPVVDTELVTLGKWQQAPGSTDLINVWGVRHNEHWYALGRHGLPWGPKLDNFKPHKLWHVFKLDKLLPNRYTRKIIKDALPASLTKLHNATTTLKSSRYAEDSGQVVKMLMGDNSSAARKELLARIEEVMVDAAKVTPDNFYIEKGHDGAAAALNPKLYQDWINTYGNAQKNKKFMVIYTDTFNEYYRTEGYSQDVVADMLIHELFHGTPNTLDHAYTYVPASGRIDNFQRLDVAPLLNLASGNFRNKDTLMRVNKAAAFDNADSFTLTTSLLSQLAKDPALYRENIAVMTKALERSRGEYIGWEVLVKLNPV